MNMTQISKGKKIRSSFVLVRLIRDVLADAKSTHSYSSDIHILVFQDRPEKGALITAGIKISINGCQTSRDVFIWAYPVRRTFTTPSEHRAKLKNIYDQIIRYQMCCGKKFEDYLCLKWFCPILINYFSPLNSNNSAQLRT